MGSQGRVRGTEDKSAEYTTNQALAKAEQREKAGQALQPKPRPASPPPVRVKEEFPGEVAIKAKIKERHGQVMGARILARERGMANPNSVLGQQQRGKR